MKESSNNTSVKKYVVIGSSAAGINGIRGIRQFDQEGTITLISKDKAVYSRCILHHYMEGIRDLKKLCFVEPDFMESNRINWIAGVGAAGVDTGKQEVLLEDGTHVPYDQLLIAAGSHSFFPPIGGAKIQEIGGVYGFRNLEDIDRIMEEAKHAENIVVLGAGLVGIDCISGLLHLGKQLHLVEMNTHMLAIQLDRKAASAYEKAFADQGVKQYYEKGISRVCPNETGHVEAVELADGTRLPCDLLIVTAGVRANVEFLQDSGIETDRFGLIIDAAGRTNVENVYGAGDVTGRNPIWPVAVKEGLIAGANMTGHDRRMTDFFASKSTMNFQGIPTMSLGIHDAPDDTYQVETELDERGNYKKLIHRDGVIYGALLQGDLSYAGVLTQLIRAGIDVSKVKKPLFKLDYSDFFHVKDNFEFTYRESSKAKND